jgi:hypothetical protein
MIHFVVALQVLAASSAPISPKDSAKLVERARAQSQKFFVEWRRAWVDSELRLRRRLDIIPDTFQVMANSCNNSELFGPPDGVSLRPLSPISRGVMDFYGTISHPNRIKNPTNIVNVNFDVCPIWATNNLEDGSDSRRTIDQEVIGLQQRARIQWLHRRPLIALLDTIAAKIPGDAWIAGQRVRFYLDQPDTAGALRAADECRSERWWCTALRGFIDYRSGNLRSAEMVFQRAIREMSPAERCKWTDISPLLDANARMTYQALDCASRAGYNSTFWWLADPLYVEEGNEREVEQFARKLIVALHDKMDLDERWDWRTRWGGVARAELVERYGWPSRMRFWGPSFRSPFGQHIGPPLEPGWIAAGERDKRAHQGLAATVLQYGVEATTVEYWGPQYRTTPPGVAVDRPFEMSDTVWKLGPTRWGPAKWDTTLYWPPEFYRRYEGDLLGLDHQIGFLRRNRATLLVAAAAWDSTDGFVAPPRSVAFGLVTTTGPGDEMAFSLDSMGGRDTARSIRVVQPGPQLVALEMVSASTPGPARRARFGVTAPGPIARPDSLAVSDPLFVDPTVSTLGMNPMVAVARMLPTTTLRNPSRVGVYWEVYGLPPGDTTSVSMRVIRITEPGVLDRVLNTVGLGPSRDTVTIRWNPGQSNETIVSDGFRVSSRSIVLNLEAIAEGEYVMEIVMQPVGRIPAISRRAFRIVR